MADYRVELSRTAAKTLKKMDSAARRQVVAALAKLAREPRPKGFTMLKGVRGVLRIRVGDYRIIYEVHDNRLVVLVLTIGHRRDVYRDL